MRPVCEQKTYHGAVFAATVAAGLPPRLLPPYFGLVFETSQSVRRYGARSPSNVTARTKSEIEIS